MIHSFDNPPFAPDPSCPSCGKPWVSHPGIAATCAENRLLCSKLLEMVRTFDEQNQYCQELETRLAALEPPETPK